MKTEARGINIRSIKIMLRKAEDVYTMAREIGAQCGVINSNIPYNMVVEPYFIVDMVQKKMGVSVTSTRRKQEIVEAKQIIIYLLRKYTVLSLKSISEYVSLKDHTSVLHHIKQVEGFLDIDDYIREVIEDFEKQIYEKYESKYNGDNI